MPVVVVWPSCGQIIGRRLLRRDRAKVYDAAPALLCRLQHAGDRDGTSRYSGRSSPKPTPANAARCHNRGNPGHLGRVEEYRWKAHGTCLNSSECYSLYRHCVVFALHMRWSFVSCFRERRENAIGRSRTTPSSPRFELANNFLSATIRRHALGASAVHGQRVRKAGGC